MTRYDLLIQMDPKRLSGIICELVKEFQTPEEIERQLYFPVSEEEIHAINQAAKRENQSISFSFTGEREVIRPRGTDSAKVIQVIKTESARGKGTPGDLSRIVTQYWDFDGVLLAENDPCVTETMISKKGE